MKARIRMIPRPSTDYHCRIYRISHLRCCGLAWTTGKYHIFDDLCNKAMLRLDCNVYAAPIVMSLLVYAFIREHTCL